MNRNLYLLLALILCGCLQVIAQADSVNWLNEVVLSDVKLKNNSTGQLVQTISDSLIKSNEPLLTDLLKYNSPFFFRENGYGMVASASVRGTGASQTAVVWNGININSQFTGQTDFNTVNTKVFDNISLRPGGGSVIYGSGAIGGSIHLNNDLSFNNENSNRIYASYGSFNTYQAAYNGKYSNELTSFNVSISGITSDNDYEYPNVDVVNANGDFSNISISAAMGHWLNDNNILKFYSNYYTGDRGFSGTLNLDSQSKYEDRNSRNLLEWKHFTNSDLVSSLKLAYLKEEFKYFENRNSEDFNFGEASSFIAKYDLLYHLDKSKTFNFIADYTGIDGKGSSLSNNYRKTGGVSVLWNHKLEKFSYELSLRKELTDDFQSPLLFSLGGDYQLSKNYQLRFNFSRNYRIPTFNDLFWFQGGNQNLQPEKSLQAEIGTNIIIGDLNLNATAFYIDIDELLRWIPDNSGTWRPVNTANVYNYGLEFFAGWTPKIIENNLNISANYSFTRSIDKNTGNQLIYTPKHKASFNGAYEIGNLIISVKSLYNGSIFTSSDNNYVLEDYILFDLGANYRIRTNPEIKLGANARNIFNKAYQSLPGRLMPGRSFNTTLTINF